MIHSTGLSTVKHQPNSPGSLCIRGLAARRARNRSIVGPCPNRGGQIPCLPRIVGPVAWRPLGSPALQLDQSGHSAQGPYPFHVSQRLGPALEPAFHPPQVHWSQTGPRSCRPRLPQTALASCGQLFSPMAHRLSMNANLLGVFRLAQPGAWRLCAAAPSPQSLASLLVGFPCPHHATKPRKESLCYATLNRPLWTLSCSWEEILLVY